MHDEPTLTTFLITSLSKTAQRGNLLDNANKCLSNLDFLEANEMSMKEGLINRQLHPDTQIMLSGKQVYLHGCIAFVLLLRVVILTCL